MKKILILLLLASLSLGSCITIKSQAETPAPPLFVTSTLPSTKPGLSLPTDIPPTVTPEAGTPAAATSARCKDSAVLLEDVTVPDNTQMPRGEKFTKTWRFKNTGKCAWNNYSIAFAAGDRMGAADSAPVPQTGAGDTVDISVDLVAPAADGVYTGYFELRNADDKPLFIGTEKTFWVKIIIGDVIIQPTTAPSGTASGATPVSQPKGPASCKYVSSPSYPNEIANLINSARAQAGLPALTINAQLTAAAQGHSIDMACFSLLSHTGTDSSSVHERIVAAGYAPSYSEEIIYGGGYPQNAFDWWMNDKIHRDAILNPNVTEMGVGYAYVSTSSFGSYYTVDFGHP